MMTFCLDYLNVLHNFVFVIIFFIVYISFIVKKVAIKISLKNHGYIEDKKLRDTSMIVHITVIILSYIRKLRKLESLFLFHFFRIRY